jgi:RNA polymerase sigma-70 factor (ECF subfamily)
LTASDTNDAPQVLTVPQLSPASLTFVEIMIGELPKLRGAAFMMTRSRADADDLIQTTAMRALAAHRQFTMGTNMRGWLYRIMRNEFIDHVRSRSRATSNIDDVPEEFLKSSGTQEEAMEMRDVMRAVKTLSPMHREALFLYSVEGMSYEEIAQTQSCAVGTVKSRISRARQDIKAILEKEPAAEATASNDDIPNLQPGA